MPHFFADWKATIITSLKALMAEGLLPACPDFPELAITAEPPREASHGDVATNAAMVLAKPMGKKPLEIAQILADRLRQNPDVAEALAVGPGFLNLRLAPHVWPRLLSGILDAGANYGTVTLGHGTLVNVEYVSANPTGPMHIGHARGAVVGDVLARVLAKAGYQVTKEYYINDAGAQVDVLARSTHVRYREALGEDIGEIPAGLYPGDYLKPVGKALAEEFGERYRTAPEAEWLHIFREQAIRAMLAMIKEDLAGLGVAHDVFSSEKAITDAGKVEEAIAHLTTKGLIYQGVLEAPKGKQPDDWEPRPQTLFKSSEFGDDTDRALKKSDGSYTYFAPDIAYHYDKISRGADIVIDVLGADHGGYVKRIRAAVAAMSDGRAECHVLLCQLVKLMQQGQPFKMSKRAGTFITLRDMVELLGKDVLRFIMLTRKSDASLEFDVDVVREQTKDNPVFYVQYAHARCHSAQHMQLEQVPAAAQVARQDALAALPESAELQGLISLLASWPRVVEASARHYEPHRVAFYLQDLAAAFHGFWNLGNSQPSYRFVQADAPERTAGFGLLLQAVQQVLASGLDVMGVEPMNSM